MRSMTTGCESEPRPSKSEDSLRQASGEKQAQWTALLKIMVSTGRIPFASILDAPGLFLSPMLDAIGNRKTIEGAWPASGSWNLVSD
jgi:hypothetical protein